MNTGERKLEKRTTAGGTTSSAFSSSSSISAAESQSMLSLFAAALRSTPVSVAFAYKDLLGLVFGASTYTTNKKKEKDNIL